MNFLKSFTSISSELKMDDAHCNPLFEEEDIDWRAAYVWFKVKKTQVEMMRDRGLEIPEDEMFLLSFDETKESEYTWQQRMLPDFVRIYRDKAEEEDVNFNTALSNVYRDPETNVNTVVVYLCRERESLSITTSEFTTKFDYYTKTLGYYNPPNQLKMVFISEVDVNKKEESVAGLNYISTQFFLTKQLVYNPTLHTFYYPHRLLNEDERREELAANKIRPEQLPIILKMDPIVQYFDWPVDGIVKIDRTEHYLEMPSVKGYYLRLIK